METTIKRSAARARILLKERGLPYSDEIELHASGRQFPGGGHYGIEIPVVTSLTILETTIRLLQEAGINRARFGETVGSFLLSDSEIKEMLHCCAENGYGMLFSIGPRPEYDRKATFYRTDFGIEQGRALNNNEAFAHAVDGALRLIDFGCRGIINYDIGVLRTLSRLRTEGIIPQDTVFATSTHSVVSNAMIAEAYVENGADNLVVLHDVGLPVLQDIRAHVPDSVSISLPIDVYKSKGGFIRYGEIPEIVQICAPVFLKLGASAQAHPYDPVGKDNIARRIKRIEIGLEHLARSGIEATYLPDDSPFWLVPRPAQSASTSRTLTSAPV